MLTIALLEALERVCISPGLVFVSSWEDSKLEDSANMGCLADTECMAIEHVADADVVVGVSACKEAREQHAQGGCWVDKTAQVLGTVHPLASPVTLS